MAQAVKGLKKNRIKGRREMDGVYLILLCALVCVGLLMLISASTPEHLGSEKPFSGIIKNCAVAVFGFGIMIGVAIIGDYMFYKKFAGLFYYASVLVMFLTPFIGDEKKGATRWIDIGPLSIQPSEVMKIALILYLADVLSSETKRDMKKMNPILRIIYDFRAEIIIVIPAGCALLQRHLSGAVVICAIGFIMLLAYGMKPQHIAITVGGGIAAVVFFIIAEPFRVARIIGYTNPEKVIDDEGWQIIQSLYAICSGGLFGVGFGQSRQKYTWLPEASNDYIFAVVCEELGIIGASLIIIMFGAFVWRGIKIAINAREMFGTLVAFGVSVMIGIQAFLNVAIVTNLFPPTGVQLPFFSKGGTSLLFMMIAVGLVLNISRYQKQGAGNIYEVK